MFSRNLQDYVIAQDVTNHLQVKKGDIVTISHAAWKQGEFEKHFITTVVVTATATACTMGLATGFMGVGIVGSGIAEGLTAVELAALASSAGGTAGAIGHKLITDAMVAKQTLDTVPFLGKVKRIDNKLWSELKHVEIEFYIPSDGGSYQKRTEWVDAHHLMKLITKHEDAERTAEIQRKAAEAQRTYDAELQVKHRKEFAPENVMLQDANAQLTNRVQRLNRQQREAANSEATPHSLRNLKRISLSFKLSLLLLPLSSTRSRLNVQNLR